MNNIKLAKTIVNTFAWWDLDKTHEKDILVMLDYFDDKKSIIHKELVRRLK